MGALTKTEIGRGCVQATLDKNGNYNAPAGFTKTHQVTSFIAIFCPPVALGVKPVIGTGGGALVTVGTVTPVVGTGPTGKLGAFVPVIGTTITGEKKVTGKLFVSGTTGMAKTGDPVVAIQAEKGDIQLHTLDKKTGDISVVGVNVQLGTDKEVSINKDAQKKLKLDEFKKEEAKKDDTGTGTDTTKKDDTGTTSTDTGTGTGAGGNTAYTGGGGGGSGGGGGGLSPMAPEPGAEPGTGGEQPSQEAPPEETGPQPPAESEATPEAKSETPAEGKTNWLLWGGLAAAAAGAGYWYWRRRKQQQGAM